MLYRFPLTALAVALVVSWSASALAAGDGPTAPRGDATSGAESQGTDASDTEPQPAADGGGAGDARSDEASAGEAAPGDAAAPASSADQPVPALTADGEVCEPPDETVRHQTSLVDGELAAEGRRTRFIGLPVLGYTPDTSLAVAALGMLRFKTRSCGPNDPTSSVTAAASYTLRQQWLVTASPQIVLRGDRIRLNGNVLVQDWETDFFGIGDGARLRDLETYDPRRVRLEGELQGSIAGTRLFIGFLTRFSWVDIRALEPGGILDTAQPAGVGGGITYGFGLTATWDSRDSQTFPTEGAYVRGRFGTNPQWLGSDYEYTVASLDARGFVDVGTRRTHVLAGQLYLEGNAGDVPFYELAALGGSSLLRGMTEGRFRDNNLWAAQAEYRTPFFWRIGFVAFAGLGDVAHRVALREYDDPKWTAGAGLRIQADRQSGVNIRLDYGFSNEEFDGIYFSIGEAF